ncbi:MAG: carboxypeptidase-like regulatory domain-containing protein [Bacteroidota bacterium]
MKRVFIFISVCFIAMSFYSCRLGSNKIFGYISFIDTTSGGNYETPESKVTIELINEARANVSLTTTTDDNGWFEIGRLSNGTYRIHASKYIRGMVREATSDKIILIGGNESSASLYLD